MPDPGVGTVGRATPLLGEEPRAEQQRVLNVRLRSRGFNQKEVGLLRSPRKRVESVLMLQKAGKAESGKVDTEA